MRSPIVTPFPDHILDAAREAAERRGIPLEEWLDEAVSRLAELDTSHQYRVERQPGPWPGWSASFLNSDTREICVYYSSADGKTITKMDATILDRRYRMTAARRPWMAQDCNGLLRNKSGACRTFSSAEAAKKALEQNCIG
jgi:hypothetical protein